MFLVGKVCMVVIWTCFWENNFGNKFGIFEFFLENILKI